MKKHCWAYLEWTNLAYMKKYLKLNMTKQLGTPNLNSETQEEIKAVSWKRVVFQKNSNWNFSTLLENAMHSR